MKGCGAGGGVLQVFLSMIPWEAPLCAGGKQLDVVMRSTLRLAVSVLAAPCGARGSWRLTKLWGSALVMPRGIRQRARGGRGVVGQLGLLLTVGRCRF